VNHRGGVQPSRHRAVFVLLVTLLIAIVAWLFVRRATESGIERLATLDRVRAHCDSLWSRATTRADSMRVQMVPLPDTVDPRSSEPIQRCGDLQQALQLNVPPSNPRDLTGEPMPPGLR
jgi:hypothetical protein